MTWGEPSAKARHSSKARITAISLYCRWYSYISAVCICFFEKNATGCKIPVLSHCDRIPPETKSEASSQLLLGFWVKVAKTGVVVNAVFKKSKKSWQWEDQSKGVFLHVSSVSALQSSSSHG
jgi:hypothetical protein